MAVRRSIPRDTGGASVYTILGPGEILFDLTRKKFRVGDGVRPGGIAMIDDVTLDDSLATRPITRAYSSQTFSRIRLGYGEAGAAIVMLGGSAGFAGDGIAMIGGGGPRDAGNGTFLGTLGHPNWPALQPSIDRAGIELALYSNNTSGKGTSTGSTLFTATAGTFKASDVGGKIWLDEVAYTIEARISPTQVTLSSAPVAGAYIWHIVKTSGTGTCSVVAGVVTRLFGDPFIPHEFGSDFTFRLNGAPYTVTASGGRDGCTVAAPPANGTYTYAYETNINEQLSALRLGPQFPGSDEENLSLLVRTTGYEIRSLYAGAGRYRDLTIGSGEFTPGSLASQIVIGADGKLVLGGPASRPTMLIDHSTALSVNFLNVAAGPSGLGPSVRARGSDANIDLFSDTQGTGSHYFTVGSFATIGMQIYGVAGNDYLAVGANTGSPYITATGASTNANINALPKGTGVFRVGNNTAADRFLTVSRASGFFGGVRIETGFSPRFDIAGSNVVESGGNVGTDLNINRFSDAGTYLGTPISIKRSTGVVTLEKIAAVLTNAADDAAAAAAGVVVGQFYRTANAVKVRSA